MSNPKEINLDKLVSNFEAVEKDVVTQVNAVGAQGQNPTVSEYMKLQVKMNQMNQVGTLLTNVVTSVNSLILKACTSLQAH